MRYLLHDKATAEQSKCSPQSQALECEELNSSHSFVEGLLEGSLHKLQEERIEGENYVRWELGACWVQHLQDQKKTEKDKKSSSTDKTKNEMKVEGLGTPLKSLKSKKKTSDGETQNGNLNFSTDNINVEREKTTLPSETSQVETEVDENELMLNKLLPDSAFMRLKESETGLHQKVKNH